MYVRKTNKERERERERERAQTKQINRRDMWLDFHIR